ncbi:ATP-binding protein [Actinokineospora spheciospongiae]|nr:hypothetical protein [Actinokineospora spheciospongiae]
MTSMKGYRCWESEAVRQTVYSDIGALPADADALFLAAHTPMSLEHPHGRAVAGEGAGERDVLNALRESVGDQERNTLIAVTGGSGAGKSHVVRWVHANLDLDENRYHVLYVPRAIQTIRELLRRIVEGLPVDGGQFMERIDAAVGGVGKDELKDRLLEGMRSVLTWNLEYQQPREGETEAEAKARQDRNSFLGSRDETGKRRGGLADLLSLEPVNTAMLAAGGTIDRVIDSIFESTSRRDGEAEFTRSDLPLKKAGMLRALRKDEILADFWSTVTADLDMVIAILDEAAKAAMGKVLGLRTQDGDTLDALFRQARQALKQQGKELVMLFEDLAQFGLIDGELYDQFATQPGEGMAPLRVVFAVTDGPFEKIVDTVRTRIAHRFVVSDDSLADRPAFLGRYLNLVRLGRDEVREKWRAAQEDKQRDWVANACDSRGPGGDPCPIRQRCHEGFGTVEVPGLGEVGLYPYNEVALRRALQRPTIQHRSPRADLDFCVSDALVVAHTHIGRLTYPPARTFEQFEHTVHRQRAALVRDQTGDEADRLYRALVLWGDEQPLAPIVHEAFALPAATEHRNAALAPTTESAVEPRRRRDPASQSSPTKRGAKNIEPPDEKNPLQPLFQWRTGEPMADKETRHYRELLFTLVQSRINLDEHLVHPRTSSVAMDMLSGYFKKASFDFGADAQGRTAGAGSIQFRLERNDADVELLMAARWYYDHFHWDPDSGKWPWPESSDPLDLALTLEQKLDEWADAVVDGFLDWFDPAQIAKTAVAVRTIALMCAGVSPKALNTLEDSLEPLADFPTAPAWRPVLDPTAGILSNPLATELLAEFATVRQGEGGAGLVDAATALGDLPAAVAAPVAYLDDAAKRYNTDIPIIAAAAKKLRTAVVSSAPALLEDAWSAKDRLKEGLSGDKSSVVAKAAEAIGRRAKEANLFRPADGYQNFENALKTLIELPTTVLRDRERNPSRPQGDTAILAQDWASGAVEGDAAFATVRRAIEATREECRRNTPEFAELDEIEKRIQVKADAIRKSLESASGAVDSDA